MSTDTALISDAQDPGMEKAIDCQSPSFFQRNTEPRDEVVEGLIREGQIVTVGGSYGVGKSPVLQDLMICRLNGIPWCGHEVRRGPVVVFDFENSGPSYKRSLTRIARRYNVPEPRVPEELEPYLQNDDPHEPLTATLLHVLRQEVKDRFALLNDVLKRKPDAFVIIDPTEMLFNIDTRDKRHVNHLFANYRLLLADFPKAVILGTFNMRKLDPKAKDRPNLISEPRGWLEDVCGSNDLMSRCDVRLGMAFNDAEEEIRVINGVRRGESMHPILVRPFGDSPENLAGFEVVAADQISLVAALTTKQAIYWGKLPDQFTFSDAVGIMGKSTFSRLKARVTSLGLLEEVNGVYRKKAFGSG